MFRKQFVYIVGYGTDQYNGDGEEILVVYAIKLTRAAADDFARRNPGTSVYKREADKD